MELVERMVDGEGAPLVFLHGWLGSKASWQQVRSHLNVPNPMLFYDHRCHGESPCSAFDFDDLAADLHELVTQHGFENPILVGHSMGGMVALTYATQYDSLGGLFLSGTCASTPTPEVHSPSWFLDRFDEMDREEWVSLIVDNYIADGDYPALRNAARQEIMAANRRPIVDGLQAMVDYDVRDTLSTVDVPAHVLGATDDQAITGERIEEVARLLDCEYTMVDTCHLITEAEPERFATLLEAFVQRLEQY
ncbi:MAG: alpha/beta fold hydrolase [Candidatus Nanohaloarchaea archaeon]